MNPRETQSRPSTSSATNNPPASIEAAILSMSDAEYMNREQLAYFRARLSEMRDDLLAHANETKVHLQENEPLADPNDRATVEEENLLEQRVRDRERKHLRKIEAALSRIERGSYGYCLESGEPIGLQRLIARPTAEYCLEVQEAHERLERIHLP